jgi:hypothetical protein
MEVGSGKWEVLRIADFERTTQWLVVESDKRVGVWWGVCFFFLVLETI